LDRRRGLVAAVASRERTDVPFLELWRTPAAQSPAAHETFRPPPLAVIAAMAAGAAGDSGGGTADDFTRLARQRAARDGRRRPRLGDVDRQSS
jgi:hypothetical protein